MIDYDYSTVTVELLGGADTDTPWIRKSLLIEPKDEKLILTYQDFGFHSITISLECHIGDWKDLFPGIVEERIHLNRSGGAPRGETISPKDLKITGQLNPLINMIVFAFCAPQAAHLSLKLIDCDAEDLENFLNQNRNLQLKSAVKYAKIVDEFMDQAFLRMKYLVADKGLRLSQILKIARNAISQYEEQILEFQEIINLTKNKIAYARGRFLVVEVFDTEAFDNIYTPAQYAVIDLDIPYDYNSKKPLAVAVGNKRAEDYLFTLTGTHVEWEFSCDTLSEIPESVFSATESYWDMVS
jgi:hypothetical protein